MQIPFFSFLSFQVFKPVEFFYRLETRETKGVQGTVSIIFVTQKSECIFHGNFISPKSENPVKSLS